MHLLSHGLVFCRFRIPNLATNTGFTFGQCSLIMIVMFYQQSAKHRTHRKQYMNVLKVTLSPVKNELIATFLVEAASNGIIKKIQLQTCHQVPNLNGRPLVLEKKTDLKGAKMINKSSDLERYINYNRHWFSGYLTML